MKKSLIAAALVAAMPASAFAADLGVVNTAAPVAYESPSFSWTGFYLGANAGYSWAEIDEAGLGGVVFDNEIDGITGGIQAGYNYDFGGFVLGLEADAQLADIEETVAVGYDYNINSFGSVRARAGVAIDRALPYITGGLAWANAEIDTPAGSDDNTLWGWTIGAGLEYAVTDNMTVKGEYLYADYDGETYFDSFDSDFTTHTVRVGLNYKF